MKIREKIAQLDSLKEKLEILRPLNKEARRKIDDKYRLEWNFHSNHIEGNTLTYGETELLLFRGKSSGDHDKRDFDEMEAHDLAVELVKDWSSDRNREITESDLRYLNKIILVRAFWKEAITSDGYSTRKQIIPGEYKNSPNSVRLKNGQIHHYSSPGETPALMKDLFDTYNFQKGSHPLILAAVTHHKFTQIHPFDDGNGRVARLWSNYILLKSGYTPLIIRTSKKENYLTALQKADVGDIDPLVIFFVDELLWSISISLNAARGKNIQEDDDLDKKIALLDMRIKNIDGPSATEKNSTQLNQIVNNSFFPLLDQVDFKIQNIKKWFNSSQILVNKNDVEFKLSNNEFRDNWTENELETFGDSSIYSLSFLIKLDGFIKGGVDTFDISAHVNFRFSKWKWVVSLEANSPTEYSYNQTTIEINQIVSEIVNILLATIERTVQKLNRNIN